MLIEKRKYQKLMISLVWPNGDLLNYTVRITKHGDKMRLSEQNVMVTTFTATSLSAGVPYNVSITPVNLAGPGSIKSATIFTRELTPSVAPKISEIFRTSRTTIMVSWKRLTLPEARGFITFYIIEYYPLAIENKRQLLDVMRIDINSLLSSATIGGLDENLDYIVQVLASTSAGNGVTSNPRVVRTFQLAVSKDNTGAIVGSVTVVAVMMIVAVTAIIIVIIIAVLKFMRRGQKPNNSRNNGESNISFELKSTYDVVDDKSHDYEVITKVKTNKIEPPPTHTDGGDDFNLNQCPAYVLVPTPRNNDEGDLTDSKDGLYEMISSP